MNNELDCFIAYPSSQRQLAEAIHHHLLPEVVAFIDSRALRPGDHWPQILSQAIAAAAVTVVVVAPESERAFYEQEEIATALSLSRAGDSERRVVPVFVDGMTPADTRVPYGLRIKQGFVIEKPGDLARAVAGIKALVLDIRTYREAPTAPGAAAVTLSPMVKEYLAQMRIHADRLTREQYRIINNLQHVRRVRISGSAGSGKTLVAAEKSIRLAASGAKVLFLCHNPLLAEYVQGLTRGSGVIVRDFVQWISELLSRDHSLGEEWTHYFEPLQNELDAARQRLVASDSRYDAIIVDEGQDFRSEWWQVVKAALCDKARSQFYIFHDNRQSLLAHRGFYPIEEPQIDLSRNCRNAGRILDLMRYFDDGVPNPEQELRGRGIAIFRELEPGQDWSAVSLALSYFSHQQILDEAVVLVATEEPLRDTALHGCRVRVTPYGGWKREVRRVIEDALRSSAREGSITNRRTWGSPLHELDSLSSEPFPSRMDAHVVRRLAEDITINEAMARLEKPHVRWEMNSWQPQLISRGGRRVTGTMAVLHLRREDWYAGLPEPKEMVLRSFRSGDMADSIPLYRVSDFKGLEAEAVLLILRGKTPQHREAMYVGLSRARTVLYVLADSAAASTLPRSFKWDRE